MALDLRIFTEPQQGATFDDQAAAAQAAERAGFSAFFRSDHYLKMGGVTGLPGPTDSWVTLAGLARETSTIRLGTLVTSATFRHPGVLAISVAEVDQMSNGRVEFGIGAGWYENEHKAYAIPFPTLGERFERFEEQLQIISGLWSATTTPEAPFTFSGKHYAVTDSPGLPKPTQSTVPIIIGGGGPKRTPRLAATFAAEFNVGFCSAEVAANSFARVEAACDARGRNPKTLAKSVALVTVCGESDREIERRAAAIGREVGELRQNGLCGTPTEITEKLRSFEAVGAQRIYLQLLDMRDLAHIELLGAMVRPSVAG